MVGLLRVAFVNTSENTTVTIYCETADSVEVCQLLTTTPAKTPEENPGKVYPAGGWELVVPPGTIFGFVTEKPVNITNLNSAAIATIYADGKDPWPQPPPLTPLAKVADFATRYESFLMGGAAPNPKQKPIVMRLAHTHTTP